MNKEDFLKYITQAIEAMDGSDIEALFPDNRQPDLHTFAEELIGLRGEVKKVVQARVRCVSTGRFSPDPCRCG